MNNPFKSAEKVQKRLKVLVYGESGTGKTWFALTFPGKIAVIDTEGGTELYGGRSDVQEFDVIRTKSYEEVMTALDFIEADDGKTYQTLVVDPITVVYQVLQEAAARNSKARDGAIDMRGWGIIKTRMNRLYVRLTNLPIHVVVTSRLKEAYEQSGSDLVRAGVKPDSEKSTPYLFDIVLRLENNGKGRRALVEKDRSGTLGSEVKSISFANLAAIADAHAEGATIIERTEEEYAAKDAEQMARELNPHWIDREDARKAFWRYTKEELGLTESQAHLALSVAHIREFTGDMAAAKERLDLYADSLWNSQPEGQTPVDGEDARDLAPF